MFDVSFSELLIIGVIALVVIGPERLPKVAKTVGHLLGRAQRYVNDVKADIQREIELDELRKFKSEMDQAAQSMHSSLRETEESIRGPVDALKSDLEQGARAASDTVAGRLPTAHTADGLAAPSAADSHSAVPPANTSPAPSASEPLPAAAQPPAASAPASTPAVPPPVHVASAAAPDTVPPSAPSPTAPIGNPK